MGALNSRANECKVKLAWTLPSAADCSRLSNAPCQILAPASFKYDFIVRKTAKATR